MKKSVHLLMIAWPLLMLWTCSKPNPDNGGQEKPPVVVEEGSITIPSSQNTSPVLPNQGGESSISFTATDSWTASVTSTKASYWCIVSPQSGSKGNARITIKVEANDQMEEREAVVEIKCGKATQRINVRQQGTSPAIELGKSSISCEASGWQGTIEVVSNVDVSVRIPDGADWVTCAKTKAMTSHEYEIKVFANDGLESRSTTIEFYNPENGLSKKITVTQLGTGPSLEVNKTELSCEASGWQGTIEVVSNFDVSVRIPDGVDWVTYTKTKAMTSHEYEINVSANDGLESRSTTIEFYNSEYKMEKAVVVNQKGTYVALESVTMDKGNLEMKVNDESELHLVFTPDNATYKTARWSVSDESVISITPYDNYCVVRALKLGVAQVTAVSTDKSLSAACYINVNFQSVTAVSLDKTSQTIAEGETFTLVPTVSPEDATDKSVKWESTNPAVASVEKGVVKGLTPGETKITVRTNDGGYTAVCTVIVNLKGLSPSIGDWDEGDEYEEEVE